MLFEQLLLYGYSLQSCHETVTGFTKTGSFENLELKERERMNKSTRVDVP